MGVGHEPADRPTRPADERRRSWWALVSAVPVVVGLVAAGAAYLAWIGDVPATTGLVRFVTLMVCMIPIHVVFVRRQ